MSAAVTHKELIAELVGTYCRLRAIASRMDTSNPRQAACAALADQAGSTALLAAYRLDATEAAKAADAGRMAYDIACHMYALAGLTPDQDTAK